MTIKSYDADLDALLCQRYLGEKKIFSKKYEDRIVAFIDILGFSKKWSNQRKTTQT